MAEYSMQFTSKHRGMRKIKSNVNEHGFSEKISDVHGFLMEKSNMDENLIW